MSSSADGKTWSAVTRIPIDPLKSTVDHFLPESEPTRPLLEARLT